MTTLQERRRHDLLAQIERAVERRERIIASLMRATTKIATMARQVRRYEKMVAALTPRPVVPIDKRRPAKVLAKKTKLR